ncbi:alpha/beta hydrolase [Neorhizobium sp. NCHU2750]|uniref:alpha/beta fold hydrolase n=1 Tax=Neorhizobium sp. NCHU2750 TaxID=1825976 RepID=UPI000E73CB2F|nr:alpha/beta hydrolase [Neorhizobium sp. NCHU2750]
MKIRSKDIELHVEDAGAGQPALVFLHYWGGSSRTWRHVTERLQPEFRTIAIDQRGWGKSDDAPGGDYALTDLAGDAEAVIDALGLDRYVLVGHSMGGKAAQLLASRQPTGLAGLVLVAPSPPSPLGMPLEVRQGMVGAYASRESIMATVDQVLAGSPLGADDLEGVIADSLRGADAAKSAWPLSTSQEDITADVAHITVPVLVISGENDHVDPPTVLRQELLPRIPQAELHILKGVGHLSPLEAPDSLADLIGSFVRGLGRMGA